MTIKNYLKAGAIVPVTAEVTQQLVEALRTALNNKTQETVLYAAIRRDTGEIVFSQTYHTIPFEWHVLGKIRLEHL